MATLRFSVASLLPYLRFRSCAVAAMSGFFATVVSAQVTVFTWIGGTSDAFTTNNWVGASMPTGAGTTVENILVNGSTTGGSLNIPASLTLNNLTFDAGRPDGFLVTGSNSPTLALTGDISIQGVGAVGTGDISLQSSVAIVLKADSSADNAHTIHIGDSGTTVTIGANIGEIGTASVTKTGSGKLTLSGTTSFTGGLTADTGTIQLQNAGARGAGTWTFNNASILGVDVTNGLSAAVSTVFNNSARLNATQTSAITGGTQTFNSSSSLYASAGNAANGGEQRFYNNAYLVAEADSSVSGGTLKFYDNSSVYPNATNSITGVTLNFYGNSYMIVGAVDALSTTTNLYFNGSQGGTSGSVSLRGKNTSVGYISSGVAGTGGIITNDSATAATLEVNFDTDSHTFFGSLGDGAVEVGTPGALSLTKNGTGTLVLSGTNTYTGTTTINNAGTLQLASATALPSLTPLALGSYATLDLNGHNASLSALSGDSFTTIDLGGADLTVSIADSGTFDGILVGTTEASLIKTGSGSLTLGGAGYYGNTSVQAGTLTLAAEDTLRTGVPGEYSLGHDIAVSSGATLHLQADQGIRMLSGLGTVNIDGAATLTVNLPNDGEGSSSTFAGALTGDGLLKKDGPGELTLSGNSDTFTGAIALASGTLTVGHASALGTTTNSTAVTGGSLVLNNVAVGNERLHLSGTGVDNVGALVGLGNSSFNGLITLTGNTKIGATNVGDTLELLNTIDEVVEEETPTPQSLYKMGAGNLILSAANEFLGETRIYDGTLTLKHSDALHHSTLNHEYGGTLSFGPLTAATLGGLGGYQDLVLENASAQAVQLTVGLNNQFTSYSGSLTGAGSLVKVGTGTLQLGGNSTYSGVTSVQEGTLEVLFGGNLGDPGEGMSNGTEVDADAMLLITGADVTEHVVLDGGTLAAASAVIDNVTIQPALTGTITLLGNAMISVPNSSVTFAHAGEINQGDNPANLTKTGAGKLELTSTASENSFTGYTQIGGGELIVSATDALPTTTAVGFSDNTKLRLNESQTIARFLGAVSSLSEIVIAAEKNLTVATDADLNQFGGAGTFRGVISGAGGLVVAGENGNGDNTVSTLLTLTGDNTYSGGTAVTGGILRLGDNGATGSIVGDVALSNGGQLYFHRSDIPTFGGVISGNGSLQVGNFINGTTTYNGGVRLTSANTFTGATMIASGTLEIGIPNALPSTTTVGFGLGGTTGSKLKVDFDQTIGGFDFSDASSSIVVADQKTLTVALGAAEYSSGFEGVISGLGNLRIGPSSNHQLVFLTGDNTYTGSTTIDANGGLILGDNRNVGSISSTSGVQNNGTLIFNRDDEFAFTRTITGSGTVEQGMWMTREEETVGTEGATILTANNSYTGGTYVTAGGIIAAHDNALGTGPVSVSGGFLATTAGTTIGNTVHLHSGIIGGSGTFASSVTIGSAGTVSPEQALIIGTAFHGGFNTIGTVGFHDLTLAGGSAYEWNIADFQGAQAASSTAQFDTSYWEWDQILVTNGLTLSASSTERVTLKIVTLSATGVPGAISGFGVDQSYSWTILSAGSINGFDATKFDIDASGFFSNSINGGVFSLSQSGNNLMLNFTPVPEPSTWALMFGGAAALALTIIRRRRTAR